MIEREYPERGSLLITRIGNPYTERSISERIKTLAKRDLSEDRAREFETKNLRDFFHNGLLLAEINEKVIDAMMGWKREGAKQHYKIAEAVIRQAYDKAKKHWSVNSEREQLEKVKRIESQVGKFVLDSQDQIQKLQSKIEAQTAEIENLQRFKSYWEQQMKEMLQWRRMMREEIESKYPSDEYDEVVKPDGEVIYVKKKRYEFA